VVPSPISPPPAGTTAQRTCANCAAPLLGWYCHACGQSVYLHRSLRHLPVALR